MVGRMKRFALLTRGLWYGLVVGSAVGFMTAPGKGEETRILLKQKGQEVKGQAEETLKEASERAEQLARAGAARANEIAQQGQAMFNEQKVGLLSAYEGVKTGVKVYRDSAEQGSMVEPSRSQDRYEQAPIELAPPSDLSTTLREPGPEI